MSVSAHVYVDGVKPPDAKFHKMKAVWDSCREAGMDVPQKVLEYFELKYEESSQGEGPLDEGVRVPLGDVDLVYGESHRKIRHKCVTITNEGSDHQTDRVLLVDLEGLPEDVRQLRIAATFG